MASEMGLSGEQAAGMGVGSGVGLAGGGSVGAAVGGGSVGATWVGAAVSPAVSAAVVVGVGCSSRHAASTSTRTNIASMRGKG